MNITAYGNRIWVGVCGTGITAWNRHDNVLMNNHTFGNESQGIGSWESGANIIKHTVADGNGDGYSAGVGTGGEATTDTLFVCNRTSGNAEGRSWRPAARAISSRATTSRETSAAASPCSAMHGTAIPGRPFPPATRSR